MINCIHDILNFRYNIKYLKWFTPNESLSQQQIEDILLKEPYVFKNFKISIFEHKININIDSELNDVFCVVSQIHNLKNVLTSHPCQFNNLVCAGDDNHLSFNIEYLKQVKYLFKKIYYEAKDIECDWVTTLPMGTNIAYVLRCGGDRILYHVNKQKNKTKLIGSAFGSRWPGLINKITDRILLNDFTQTSKFMDNMFCDPLFFFEKLSEYKFFACPLGNGIQTPKICESILCETVPVVTNHVAHRELRDIYNIPLLIVDKWEDLTEELLNKYYDNKFKYVDWEKEKAKFLVDNFKSLIRTDSLKTYCDN